MSQFKEINEWVRKEKVSLFLGAGFSLKAGAPSCRDLINTIITGIPSEDRDEIDTTYLDKASQQFVDYYNREKLIHLIKPLFNFERKDLSDHIALSSIPHFKRIFTTNYDTLLEETYDDKCVVIKGNGDIQNQDERKAIIYKIHGDFDEPNEMIITSDDYTKFHTTPHKTLIWDILKGLLASGPMLFMGYSLEDSNLKYMIERLITDSGSHNYPIFLIAPGLRTSKRRQLEKKGIKIFDAKAEDFFNDLFIDLDKNIFKDVKRKRVAESTFHAYCQFRNLNVEVLSKLQQNEIVNVQSRINCPHKFTFTVKDLQLNPFTHDIDNFNSSLIFNGVSIPAIKVPSSQITNFSHTINGVTINDLENINAMFIAPHHEKIKCRIKISSLEFNEKIDVIRYQSGHEEVTIILNAEGYQLKIIFRVGEVNNFNTTLNIEFQQFNDLGKAIRWLNLAYALWNGNEIKWYNLFSKDKPFIFKSEESNIKNTDLEERRDYLRNIIEIEDKLNITFDNYEQYSVDAMRRSRIIWSYLYKKIITEPMPKDSTLSFEISTLEIDSIEALQIGSTNFCFGLVRESIKNLEFNGRSFSIPFQHEFFNETEVIEKKLLQNENCAFTVKLKSNFVYRWYDDQKSPMFKNIKPPKDLPNKNQAWLDTNNV